MTDLGTLSGGTESFGVAINDHGEVTGNANASGQLPAFVWSRGQMIDLGTLGGGQSSARAINNHGRVTGSSQTEGGEFHASLSCPT